MKLRSSSKVLSDEDTMTSQRMGEDIENERSLKQNSRPGTDFTILGHTINKVVLIVHVNICIYAACFFIQVGTLPYLTRRLGLDSVVFGYLQTTFAVVQLAGGPVFGRFGDLYGGRAALTLAFGSAAVSYGLMVMAVSAPILFLSRLPSVFMHAMQAGQMVVTDMSTSGDRANALGKLGLSYGIGMVIGPFVGGILTERYDEVTAAGVACAGSLFSLIMCFLYVPSKTKVTTTQHTKEETPKSSGSVFNVSKYTSLLENRTAVVLLLIKAVAGVPIGIFQSMFSVVAMETFKLEPEQNGYILSYVGIISMFTQGIGIKFLLKKTTEMNVIKLAAFILLWSYLLLACVQSVLQLCLVLVPLCIGLTLMSVVISSALTHTVADTDTGAMLGMNMAVNSMIRTVSPTVGGYMTATYGFCSIGYLGFFNNMLIAVYMFAKRVK